jgi:hypothetical protein
MRLWFALALTVVGVIPWVLLLRLPDGAARGKVIGLSVALPIVAIAVAALAPAPMHPTAQANIVLGLILTVIAAALIHSGFLPGYSGYAHLLLAYSLYTIAFAFGAGGLQFTVWLLLPLLLVGALAYRLYHRLGELWGTIMLAGGLLFLAIWLALTWTVAAPTLLGGPLALSGIVLIAIAHAAQVLGRYAPIRSIWTNPTLAYSLPAHLLISWSLWG